jgi:hypothetical protein
MAPTANEIRATPLLLTHAASPMESKEFMTIKVTLTIPLRSLFRRWQSWSLDYD